LKARKRKTVVDRRKDFWAYLFIHSFIHSRRIRYRCTHYYDFLLAYIRSVDVTDVTSRLHRTLSCLWKTWLDDGSGH